MCTQTGGWILCSENSNSTGSVCGEVALHLGSLVTECGKPLETPRSSEEKKEGLLVPTVQGGKTGNQLREQTPM